MYSDEGKEPKKLMLFTNVFPSDHGDTFISAEIDVLAEKFERIIVVPLAQGIPSNHQLPGNVIVECFEWNGQVSLRSILFSEGWRILGWWISELASSPYRWKYLRQFKWNFYRFIGLVDASNRLMKLISIHRADIYYSYWFNEWATVLALTKQKGIKGKLITRAHGYDFDEAQQSRGYHPFRYTEWGYFDRILQASEYGVNYCKKKFKNNGNLYLSRLGVQDHGFGPINEGPKYSIVSCSNLVPLKRIPLIAEVLSQLDCDFHWTHFGDGQEMGEVSESVKRILTEDKFSFAGFVSNQDLMDYYRNTPVDLFVNMSSLEGIPVSIMEAISYGIPAIGCNICGVPEIVNNRTGLLLDAEVNASIVAKQISNLLKTSVRDLEYRNEVRNFWKENYWSEKNYAMHVDKYICA